jgi:photosystem II stability/assembly factor-like uncharacterized protein
VLSEPRLQRRWRAAVLIALAVVLVAAAGAAYLHPSSATQPQSPAAAPTIDPRLVSSNPVNYDFVTPSMGWASMVSGSSSGPAEFRVFRTTDGAKHWQQQLAGQNLKGLGFSPIKVQFFGKSRGFMTIGGQPVEQLYRTEDGGDHWEPLTVPVPGINAISFSDATHGWMVAYAGSGLPALQAHIYATSDAGQTWQQLPDPPTDATYLALRSPTDVWIGSYGGRVPHVYTSSDRGQSWQRRDLPPAIGSLPDDQYSNTTIQLLPKAGVVAAVKAFRCTLLVAPSPGSSTPTCINETAQTFLFTSANDGVTWRQIPSPPGDVAYQDSVHWWSLSGNVVFKSADGGRSWRQVATIPSNLQFSSIDTLDSMHAWASLYVMGGYGLALTSDGGRHWTLAKVPQPAP